MNDDDSEKLLKSFITDIVKVFPEYSKRLQKKYIDVLDGENVEQKNEIFNEFFQNICDISTGLTENDFTLFEDDPIILENVSFKLIWGSDITKDTKNSIWRYLQTFCIYDINRKQGKEDIDDVIKSIQLNQKVSDRNTFNNIKKLKKLTESLNSENILTELKDPVKIPKNDGNSEDINKGLENILENSNIGKIAKEVTEELNIEEMLKEGGGGIENLMNGENMINIFQSISSKINMNDDNSEIMNEAKNITENMKDNPLFSNLMSSMQKNVSSENRNIHLNNNDTKKRLQKKLQQKKQQETQVNKKD